jgi:hypothetical protein
MVRKAKRPVNAEPIAAVARKRKPRLRVIEGGNRD